MISDSAKLLRAVNRSRYLVLRHLVESLREPSCALHASMTEKIDTGKDQGLSTLLATEVLPSFLSEQALSLGLLSVWSIFEQSIDELAHEVWRVRPNHKGLVAKSFAGDKIEKWKQYFCELHGLKFLHPSEESFITYVYKLRNVFAHANGCLERNKSGKHNEEELRKAYSTLKGGQTKELLKYEIKTETARVSISASALERVIVTVGKLDGAIEARVSRADELSERRGGHSLASDMEEIYV